jgi:hypothetical protein
VVSSSKPLEFPEGVDSHTPEEIATEQWAIIVRQKKAKEAEKEENYRKAKELKAEENRRAGLLRQAARRNRD